MAHKTAQALARAKSNGSGTAIVFSSKMLNFFLWCILLVLCWPLALLALVLYPVVWLLLLPFRIVGIAVEEVIGLLRGLVLLPARLLGGPRAYQSGAR